MLKLIALLSKKCPICTNDQESDSEPENISVARTSTLVKTTIATSSRTTPVNSRNTSCFKIHLSKCTNLECEQDAADQRDILNPELFSYDIILSLKSDHCTMKAQ